jgi:aspartyl-tRNA(Asn)/glutamyl-tRNA(Gln) amidotransferase subunit A
MSRFLNVQTHSAAAGLPVAMQIVGAEFSDALVLRAARAYEAAHPFICPAAP